jgi:hypothetical protein
MKSRAATALDTGYFCVQKIVCSQRGVGLEALPTATGKAAISWLSLKTLTRLWERLSSRPLWIQGDHAGSIKNNGNAVEAVKGRNKFLTSSKRSSFDLSPGLQRVCVFLATKTHKSFWS